MVTTSLDIDHSKARQSVKILYSHIEKAQPTEDQTIWLTVNTMNTVLTTREKLTMIPLKYPIQTAGTRRCLFTKDPQQTYKDWLVSQKVKGIHQVIGISKFRKQYGSKEGQQRILDEFDVFLADQRLIDILPKILGKDLYKRRTPLLMDLKDKKDIQKEVIRSIHSTVMNFKKGTSHSIKIATTSQPSKQTYENIVNAIDTIIASLPGGVDNLRSLYIKTSTSTSLPIYESSSTV